MPGKWWNLCVLRKTSPVSLHRFHCNSIVYQDISLLFYNMITLVAGTAMMTNNDAHIILYNDLLPVWNIPLWKKYLVISSAISASGFWQDTLSMNVYSGRWTVCTKHDVFTSARVLNCSEITYMGYQHNTHASNWQLSFKSNVNQNIDHWKCVTVYTLRFTPRHSSLTLRSTACYVTVHTHISIQALCVKTKSRWRYLAPQLYSQQSKLLIPMWK